MPLKVALGGAAGLLLGQLVLWWLPAAYRTDPLQLAPRLPAFVAFLAPASLRSPGRAIELLPIDVEPADDEENGQLASSLPSNDAVTQAPTRQAPEEDVTLVGLDDAPRFTADEIRATLQAAISDEAAFEARDDWSASSVDYWYGNLSRLAHQVTFTDVRDPRAATLPAPLHEFLSGVAEDPRRLTAIGDLARARLVDSDRDRKGVVLSGEVVEVVPAGDVFEARIELLGREPQTVRVVSSYDLREDASGTFRPGGRVLILGVVVDPASQLHGYRGAAETVVLGGFPVRVSAR